MKEWTIINHTAKMKGFISIKSDETAQKFHKHIQKFINDNLDCIVSSQRYDSGELLKLK